MKLSEYKVEKGKGLMSIEKIANESKPDNPSVIISRKQFERNSGEEISPMRVEYSKEELLKKKQHSLDEINNVDEILADLEALA